MLLRCLLAVLLGSVTLQGHAAGTASPVTRSEVRTALARVETALKGVALRSDVIFMFAQGNHLSGRTFEPPLLEEIRLNKDAQPLQQLEYELWRMRGQKMPGLPRVALSPEAYDLAAAGRLSPQQQVGSVMQMMSVALNCRQRINARSGVGEPGYGYVSTHQVLALALAASRGCLTRGEFEKESLPYVRRVYSEMLRNLDEASDLQVERAAFLVLVGRADLVPQRYLRSLLARQAPNGLWYLGSAPDHTSALAYLLLSSVFLSPERQEGKAAAGVSGSTPLKRK